MIDPEKDIPSVNEIQSWLTRQVAEHLGVAAKDINPDMNLIELGISSVQLASLAGEVEDWLENFVVPHEIIAQAQSLNQFALLIRNEKLSQMMQQLNNTSGV
jgi:acyl carrier protein